MIPTFFGHTQRRHEDAIPQQQQLLQQNTAKTAEATESASTSRTTSTPYKHSKLDGVLYHFYSKTLAVITNCRLTHYDPSAYDSAQSTPSTPLSESSGTANRSNAVASSSTGRRANKWFELDVADYDIFREEVRLWRNISTMIPTSVLERTPSASTTSASDTSYVPAMVLDIILDTSSLTEKHILTVVQSNFGPQRRKRRVRVDGNEGDDSKRETISGKQKEDQNAEATNSRPIVLESWRLEVAVSNPAEPPDLPTLYRAMTAHLKELFSLTKQLPVYPMYTKIQRSKISSKKSSGETTPEAEVLKIGVRLGVNKSEEEHSDDNDSDICGLREPLGQLGNSSDDYNAKVTETFTFQPIVTAIGLLQCSVEYRIDADFFVEDAEIALSVRDLELDEDYFRPAQSQAQTRSQAKAIPTLRHSPLSASPSSHNSGNQDSAPHPLLSVSSDRKQSILASEKLPIASFPGATPSPPAEMVSRSPGPAPTTPSVFSANSSSGRPVAGLSSLRRSPSIGGHGSSPTTTMTVIGSAGANASSPGPSTVLATDAAFLTHGRRTSTSERRLRSLSSLSASTDKSSPPAAATTGPPPPSPGNQPSSRPILARTSANPLPSLRSGSYSPSSPSPLAQQMSASRPAVTSQSSFRLSSSPSYRTASLPLSASPNLRSVFQLYNPSHSQTSISSLSRTPPRYITEGSSAATNSSALGLNSNSVSQSSPSQSSLAEERKPSVAPQMIKRYSSTFNYRQGRQISTGGVTGSSIESEGSNSAPYSKSWQARIEQRQHFTARSLGREDGSHLSAGSGPGGTYFSSSYSPRAQRQSVVSTSQEDDLDDFVRMIESSQPGEAASSSSTSQTGESKFSESTHRKSGLSSYTTASSGIGFTRQGGWNRNHVDEMLQKMQSSVREFSTSATSRGSGASGGAATTPSSGGSGQSGVGLESPVNQGITAGQSVSPSFVRSPLSRGGFSAASASGTSGGVAVPDGSGSTARRNLPIDRRPLVYRYNVSNSGRDSRPEAHMTSSDVREEAEAEEIEEDDHRSRRETSRGSLELFGNQPHSYDPLEDEAVGRLELVQDDVSCTHPASEARHHHQHHPHHRSNDAVASEAAERRRADLELARNFGQVVSSSSSRGTPRASLSPWRNRISSNRGGNGTGTGNGSSNTTTQ
jgi:autophagy-related protein 13